MEKMINKLLESLKNGFNIVNYSNDTYLLTTPFFHRINGTPYSIFIRLDKNNVIIADNGQTIERLLDQKDITEEYIAHKLSNIANKYGCNINERNEIEIVSDIEHFTMYFNMFIHTLIAIDNLMEM